MSVASEPLRASIERYRERAAAMTARLAELEAAGNDNARALRDALRTCSEHVEGVARLVGAPAAQDDLDWLDAPTVPRTGR